MTDRTGVSLAESYYERRERQERAIAERSVNAAARLIHLDLANRYAALARG